MRNLQLILAYDGTDFLGWQKTKEGPSIEETLAKALERLLQGFVYLQAASRTDAGVHAEAQVVGVITYNDTFPTPKLLYALQSLLPRSIAVLSIEEKPPSFHPTVDAIGKRYGYYVCNMPIQLPKHRLVSWHVPQQLDYSSMDKAAKHLLGTHDFSSFTNTCKKEENNPICTLHNIEILPIEGGRIFFCIEGNRFLFRMMRNLVGTLIYVGKGKIAPEEIPQIITAQKRASAGITAPAKGLHLLAVHYPQTSPMPRS